MFLTAIGEYVLVEEVSMVSRDGKEDLKTVETGFIFFVLFLLTDIFVDDYWAFPESSFQSIQH